MLLVATLVAGACAGGGDDGTTASNDGSARVASVELVWAIDGEPVGPEFDYTEPIARDRYDAGLRLDAVFETTGEVGDFATEIFLRTQINGDTIDGEATFGPERSLTRPDKDDIDIVTTDDGFIAQFPVGRPLSPISLVDARERAVESGIDPDDEVVEFEDTDLEFNAAGLLDFPAAPQGGRNEFLIELFGSVEFDNGFVLEIGEGVARSEIGERLVISETSTVSVPPVSACSARTEQYLELLDDELAAVDEVLLDRVRAFERIVGTQRDNDCGVRDFAIPVCDAATTATAPESVLDRHLQLCPDPQEMVEATVFEPRFDDGVVRLVVPSTRDGLPAYSVAISFPAWTIETTSEGANRQKIALSADPETVGRFTRLDIDVSAMPAGLLNERAAAAVEPEAPDAVVLRADTATIGGVPGRRLIAQLEPDAPVFQVGTAVELDSERLLTITGVVTGTDQLPIDGDGLAAFMSCIEDSMVIVEFEAGVDPVPAADCTSIVELSVSDVDTGAAGGDAADAQAESVGDPVADGDGEDAAPDSVASDSVPADAAAPGDAGGVDVPDLADAPSALFDGATMFLAVPGAGDGPVHVVSLAAPAWPIVRVRETESELFVKVDQDEETSTFVRATAEVTTDFQASADEAAAAPFDDWTVISDEIGTLGDRELRLVVMDWDGQATRRGKIITQLDEQHILIVEVNIDRAGDFDTVFATAVDSLTITP